ncbi:DNA repair protein rhp7 like [Verticillium longisporum]|nr:DNA repair protein rhp7 like [Verticillium longisporum]
MVRNVTGPRSALTSFLAANNISAQQITRDVEQRRAAAAAALQNQAQDGDDQGDDNQDEPRQDGDGDHHMTNAADETAEITASADTSVDVAAPATPPLATARQRAAEKRKASKLAADKIKARKAAKKAKKSGDDDGDFFGDLADLLDGPVVPVPGQLNNCEVCSKRFTVTPYSKAGPDGGLLCAACSRNVKKGDEKPKKKVTKSTGGVGRRRAVQSNIMDGNYHRGAKSLLTLCINTLVKNLSLAEDLGDLPSHVIDKIARSIAKRRLLDPKTLALFTRPSIEILSIYDGAKLTPDDYITVLMVCSNLRQLRVRNGIQFRDSVMTYLMGRTMCLEKLSLHGSNLISAGHWTEYLTTKGHALTTLQVYYTNEHFGDDVLALLAGCCPKLERLKIYSNQEVTSDGMRKLGDIKTLKHISLHLLAPIAPKAHVSIIRDLGKNLETLSLKAAPAINDEALTAIKANCASLTKLRITQSEAITDEGFSELFTDWSNPPLRFIDFDKDRHVDAEDAVENPNKIGLCADGFRALMAHSGRELCFLYISSCRSITKQAFEEVFAEHKQYPKLEVLDISFCGEVDDFVVGCVFRSCPKLRQLKVFGCMKVTSQVKIPRGALLIGVPNAMGVEIEGTE